MQCSEKLAQTEVSSGSHGPTSRDRDAAPDFMAGSDEHKAVLVQAEMQRMKRLPSGSSYVSNRIKVLDKMLQLLGKVIFKIVFARFGGAVDTWSE